MVMAVVGFPAGQTAEKDGVFVTLTYFNRCFERQEPDGRAVFMIVNMGDEEQIVNVSLALTQRSDFFRSEFKFKETVSSRSVVWREVQSDKIKTATYAMFGIRGDGSEPGKQAVPMIADFRRGTPFDIVEES